MMFRLGGLVKLWVILGLRGPREDGCVGSAGGWRWSKRAQRAPLRRSVARFVHGLGGREGRTSGPPRTLASGRSGALAQALAGELDAIGVVNDAVENGVGERGNANQGVPTVDGNLTGDYERTFVITILDDFEQIARLVGR